MSASAPNGVHPNLLFDQTHEEGMQTKRAQRKAFGLNVTTVEHSVNFCRFGAQ